MSFTLDASIQQLEAIRLGDGPSRKITIEHVRADIIIGWIRQRDRISRNTGKTVDLVPRISGKTIVPRSLRSTNSTKCCRYFATRLSCPTAS